jgi:hypothetical protein
LPEGKPYFVFECVDALARAGITLDEAEADFEEGEDSDVRSGRARYRYGRRAVYLYEETVILGRRDHVVVQVWVAAI